jgi:preprotein translocase subunit YajC
MKNKHHLQGKVLSQNDQYVEIELDIGTMRVSRSDVESVEIGAEIKNPEVVTNSGISGESETEVVPETMRHIGEILND